MNWAKYYSRIILTLLLLYGGVGITQDDENDKRKPLLPGREKNQVGVEGNRYSVWYDLSLYYLRTLGESQRLSLKAGVNPGFLVYDWGFFETRGITATAGLQYVIYYGRHAGCYGELGFLYAAKVFPGRTRNINTLTSVFVNPSIGLRTRLKSPVNFSVSFGVLSHVLEKEYKLLDDDAKDYIKQHLKLEYDFKLQVFYEFDKS